MAEVITVVLSFPTVLFTGAVGVSLLYWLLVIFGAADLDLLDGGADAAVEGALEGAAEGAAGALDAAEGALDAAEGALEGAAEGAQALKSGSLDLVHAAGEGSTLLAALRWMRLRDAPLTVVLSAFALWGWLINALGNDLLMHAMGLTAPALLPGLALLAASLPVALIAASVTLRPIAPIFATHGGPRQRDLIGSTCEITTGRVDHRFGQAACLVAGADAIIQVRCDQPNGLRRGSVALIVSFDRQRDAFMVEPLDAAGEAAV